jgi:class 3 adenylate cyclase
LLIGIAVPWVGFLFFDRVSVVWALARAGLNDYLTEMAAIAERWGGTVAKFVGEAMLVFFGAPVSLGERDDARRAVGMALEMRRRVEALSARWAEQGILVPASLRAGINTGVASVGNFGSAQRMDYTVIGNQVNLAARIHSRCEPDSVLISHSTWGLVSDQVECAQQGEIRVKGIHYPIMVYEGAARRLNRSSGTGGPVAR